MITYRFLQKHEVTQDMVRQVTLLAAQLSNRKRDITVSSLALSAERSYVVLARDGGKIIGIAALVLEYLPLGGCKSYVDDVVVDNAYRGKGVARSIMNKLIVEARIRGARKVRLTSNSSRVAARALYTSLGFVQRETGVFDLALDT
ncbi:MAG: GNAT family N-acetyltransferase [Patescibacteria group bacterium]